MAASHPVVTAPDPDDPVGARRQRALGEAGEELAPELPFHPEPDCPRCLDTGLVREGPSKDAFCTCAAGEARAWEVRNAR